MRARPFTLLIGALCALTSWSLTLQTARAGDPDQLIQIAPRPPGSDLIVLSYANGGAGLLYSRDRGETFSAMCASAVSFTDDDGGIYFAGSFVDTIVTGDDHVLMGDTKGLWTDDGNLCNWERVPALRDEWVTAFARDPRDPNVIFGTLASFQSEQNGVFRRKADGSIERLGEGSDIKLYGIEAVRLPDDGLRLYTLGIVSTTTIFDYDAEVPLPDGGTTFGRRDKPNYALRTSDDEGESWTENMLDSEPGEEMRLQAVDATEPDRVVIAAQRYRANDTLLVSDDAGATLREWFELEEISDVLIESSGVTWILGQGKADGVWRAERVGAEPVRVREGRVYCGTLHGEDLELCDVQDYGVANKSTATLADPKLFHTVDRVHTCEGVDLVASCRHSFCTGRCAGNHWWDSPMCMESYDAVEMYGCDAPGTVITPVVDAGADAAAPADAGPDAGEGGGGSGCSCRGLGTRSERTKPIAFGLMLLAVLVARRRTS